MPCLLHASSNFGMRLDGVVCVDDDIDDDDGCR
jgi:hypothetical protein